MIHLTYDQAVDELLKAVRERGDRYVYPEDWRDSRNLCQYALEDGSPACIVGQVLHQIGANVAALHGEDCGPRAAAEIVGVSMDRNAATLLVMAQEYQDEDTPWGEAVSRAIVAVRPDVAV